MTAVPLFIAIILAMFGKHAAAATVAGTAAVGAVAFELGVDIWPWIIGGMGCTVVYAYRPPQNRSIALANTMVSLFFAGVGAPYCVKLLHSYGAGEWANVYVLAGVLSAGWPWLAPLAWEWLRSGRAVFPFNKGGKNDV
jgi:hypothetical protein